MARMSANHIGPFSTNSLIPMVYTEGKGEILSYCVNSANNQTAGVASCIYKGTNLKSGTSKCPVEYSKNLPQDLNH
jgi:hypothetical protein